jgi:hypothetical protein
MAKGHVRKLEDVNFECGIKVISAVLDLIEKIRADYRRAEKGKGPLIGLIVEEYKEDLRKILELLSGIEGYAPSLGELLSDLRMIANDEDIQELFPSKLKSAVFGNMLGTTEVPQTPVSSSDT